LHHRDVLDVLATKPVHTSYSFASASSGHRSIAREGDAVGEGEGEAVGTVVVGDGEVGAVVGSGKGLVEGWVQRPQAMGQASLISFRPHCALSGLSRSQISCLSSRFQHGAVGDAVGGTEGEGEGAELGVGDGSGEGPGVGEWVGWVVG
jgi:hypothetical protein